jgi:hypothetical protein
VSIFPTVAVQRGCNILGVLEENAIGLKGNTINEVIENYAFSDCLYMMAVSFFVFLIIGLYLENVLPS